MYLPQNSGGGGRITRQVHQSRQPEPMVNDAETTSPKNACPPEGGRVKASGPPGGVAEWSKAAVLKTAVPQGTVGSNPTASARIDIRAMIDAVASGPAD